MAEFKILITVDALSGETGTSTEFVEYLSGVLNERLKTGNYEVELIEEKKSDVPEHFLNDNVSEVCSVESAVVVCKNIGNKYTHTVDGFPVDVDENRGVYTLHAEVFNKVPSGWDKVHEYRDYEEKQLTPWLESMGFKVDRWVDGERDSFGPLSRVGLLKRGRQKFEFIYG